MPFSTPWLVVLDSIRVAIVVTGLLITGSMLRGGAGIGVVRRVRRLGVALVLLIVVGSRLQNLGSPPTWQLAAGAVAMILLGWAEYRRIRGDREA